VTNREVCICIRPSILRGRLPSPLRFMVPPITFFVSVAALLCVRGNHRTPHSSWCYWGWNGHTVAIHYASRRQRWYISTAEAEAVVEWFLPPSPSPWLSTCERVSATLSAYVFHATSALGNVFSLEALRPTFHFLLGLEYNYYITSLL